MSFIGCSDVTISGGVLNHIEGNQNTTYNTTTTNNRDSNNSYSTRNFGDDCMTFNGGRTTITTPGKRKKKNRGFHQNIGYNPSSIPIPDYVSPHLLPYQQRPLSGFEEDENPQWNQNQHTQDYPQPYMHSNYSTPNLHPNMTSPAPYPSPPSSAPPPAASYQYAQAPTHRFGQDYPQDQNPMSTHRYARSRSPPQMQHYSNSHDGQGWSNPNPNPRYDSNPNPNNSWSSLGPSRGLSPEHYPYNQQYHQHHSPHPTYPFPFPNPNSNSNLNSQLGRHPQAPGQSHSAPSDVGHGQQSGSQSQSPPQRNYPNNPFWRLRENGGAGAGVSANEGVYGTHGGSAPGGAYGAYGTMNGEGRRGLPEEGVDEMRNDEGNYKEDEEEEGKVKKVKKRDF